MCVNTDFRTDIKNTVTTSPRLFPNRIERRGEADAGARGSECYRQRRFIQILQARLLKAVVEQVGRFRSEGTLGDDLPVVVDNVSGAGATRHHVVCPCRRLRIDEVKLLCPSESISCFTQVSKDFEAHAVRRRGQRRAAYQSFFSFFHLTYS